MWRATATGSAAIRRARCRITLAEGSRRVAVGVDWLTGRVSVANVR
jgi:hypothetical protein